MKPFQDYFQQINLTDIWVLLSTQDSLEHPGTGGTCGSNPLERGPQPGNKQVPERRHHQGFSELDTV